MQAGQAVTYHDGETRADAVILDVVGTGDSLYKRLDLQVGPKTVRDVPNHRDREGRGPCWSHEGETTATPEPVAHRGQSWAPEV